MGRRDILVQSEDAFVHLFDAMCFTKHTFTAHLSAVHSTIGFGMTSSQ